MTNQQDEIETVFTQFRNKVVEFGASKMDLNLALTHLAAWWMIGGLMGFLMLPTVSFATVIGFGIAGLILASLLAAVTYPLASHYSFILVGGAAGVVSAFMFDLVSAQSVVSQADEVCLVVGAIIGGTTLVWMTPIRAVVALVGNDS